MCISPSEETLAISTEQGQIYHVDLASIMIYKVTEKQKVYRNKKASIKGYSTKKACFVHSAVMEYCTDSIAILLKNPQADFKFLFHSVHSRSITGLSTCKSKPLFATYSRDNSVRIWNYKTK